MNRVSVTGGANATAQEREHTSLVPSSSVTSNQHEVQDNLRSNLQPAAPLHMVPAATCTCTNHLQIDQKHPPFVCVSSPTCSYCMQREALQHRSTVSQTHTPAPPPHKDCSRPACSNCVCALDSFNTLSVSSLPAGSHVMQQPVALLRSCREEAAATTGRNCLDDTTVDDLAGYLDEIMFIPKPMSEMAELMYT